MSLQNVVLPEAVIAELYKNVAIIVGSNNLLNQSSGAIESREETIKFLGNNVKNITIIVKYPTDVFLPERHVDFLTRMLTACKLNLGDVAIVNLGHKFNEISSIKKQLEPNQIILFGVDPFELKLPMNFPHFKIQGYADSAYLTVPSLDLLNADSDEGKLLKTKLWVCLKSLFEVDAAK